MKILMANHFPLAGSGSGTYTLNLARELAAMGHEVTVLAPAHEPDSGHPFTIRNLIFSNGTNTDVDLDFNFPCFTTHPHSHTTFYELTDDQVGEYVAAWDRMLADAIAESKPDVIHAQHAWVIPYCAAKLGIPMVVTIHGTDLMGFRHDERYHDMVRTAVDAAEKIITISDQIDEETQALLPVPARKTVIVHNGFDAGIFHPRAVEWPLKVAGGEMRIEAERVIAFVGKLTRFKGVDVLLRAAAIYEQRLPSVATIVAGAGELEDELMDLAEELELGHVLFLGMLSPHEVSEIFNAADVAVVPSRVEPFGLVAVEALACGTPVVATNEGGLPDFIDESIGALVDVDNHEQLAEAIVREILDETKKTKGRRAADYARERFQWSQVAVKTEAVYREALAAREA